ncbi:uncharacterized protein CDV56_101455 [Aspergillus thermomutatus]|uniref:Carboxylesterase type B domain-containing protein n=1 Tax=Aspergillus thermomutatus TaxID=41047 RepID=A0A397FWY4_ASPTH|nr:uncharacterized protein CDV56_101455 [Aspergillus thermomutatus]RHZ43282.1 hypothetical protein CDV56_101455 [Aspergillus thermomutatus]
MRFWGVPFAQPPVNDLRLRHPVPYNKRYKAYPATSQPANCPGYAGFDVGIGRLSGDCLYLNVVVPDNASLHGRLPVLVWIYGGGVADPRYNMPYIVQQSATIGKPLIFVFNNPSRNLSNYIGSYPSYHELSEFMSRSWVSFVHDLDPNGHAVDGAPYWPQYEQSQPQNIVFRTVDDFNWKGSYRMDQLKWWNAHWSTLRS